MSSEDLVRLQVRQPWPNSVQEARLAGRLPVLCVVCGVLGGVLTGWGAQLAVPNGSFESPLVGPPLYAGPQIDSWEKTPEPPGYDTNIFGAWEEKTGVFFNVPSPEPIDNVDGLQSAFLFAFPGAGFFQDYASIGGTNTTPSNEFNETYTIGTGYRLRIGAATSTTFPVAEGSTFLMRMYYRDANSNRVTVAEKTVTYSTNVYADPFHLYDSELVVPVVQAGDAWAGEHIGVELVSNVVDPQLIGGVWDLDNVRLTDFQIALVEPRALTDQFQFIIHSAPGAALEILRTDNPSQLPSSWGSLGAVTNGTGAMLFVDPTPMADQAWYIARRLPD